MRIPRSIFFIIFVYTCCPINVFASNGCGAGLYKEDAGDCTKCKAGYYCPNDNNNLGRCPTDYPNSEAGASKQSQCYQVCGDSRITNGNVLPDKTQVYYNRPCTYTKENNVKCDPGFGLTPSLVHVPDTDITKHDPNLCIKTIACNTVLSNCNGGIISGNATWDNDHWDYSTCTCKLDNQSIDNGNGTVLCNHQSGTHSDTTWSTECTVSTVTSCNPGYCTQNDSSTECILAPAGYYADSNNLQCQPCPMGSTSTDGETKIDITDCYVKPATGATTIFETQAECTNNNNTCFCDNNGCFALPHKANGNGYNVKAN